MRIELTVWTDDTVAVEVVVTRVILVVIATVCIFYLAKLLIAHLLWIDAHWLHDMAMQALVNEVPVETTLKDRILAYQVPVVLQVTARVAHRVVVLTLDERLVALRVLAILLAILDTIIHRTENVCALAMSCLFILHRATRVLALDPLVGIEEVVTHHGLVAQTPSHDGWMVVEVGYIVLVALQYLLGKHRFLGCGIVLIAETVALLVSLSYHIETILIAEVIPTWIIRIVASTNGVDVQTLHNLDVLDHALHADVVACIRIHLMTVRTLDEHRLTIDQELFVLDFHLAEAHLDRSSCSRQHLCFLLRSQQRNLQGI